jgi:acyl-homoserine lactone synthase
MKEYFHLRQEIFVNERGWRDLNCIDGREIDAYDNENAVYLLAIDQNRVVGGQRLYPTLLPHMLSGVFDHMVQRGIPRAQHLGMDALFRHKKQVDRTDRLPTACRHSAILP